MRRFAGTFGVLLLSVTLLQCDKIRTDTSDSVELARVGSARLTLDDARDAVPSFQLKQDSLRALSDYRDSWIRDQLLLSQAQSLQLGEQNEIQKRIEKARQEILKNALKELIITRFTESSDISERELNSYYEENKSQLIIPEPYVQFRHVETNELSQARIAREELNEGIYWPAVAKNYSINPEEKLRTSEKFWPVSAVLNNLPAIKPYVTSLDSGAISPIRRDNSTYHFIQLTGFREQGAFADAGWFRDEMKNWILIEKQRKHYNSYVKNLYLKAKENNELDVRNVLEPDTVNLD